MPPLVPDQAAREPCDINVNGGGGLSFAEIAQAVSVVNSATMHCPDFNTSVYKMDKVVMMKSLTARFFKLLKCVNTDFLHTATASCVTPSADACDTRVSLHRYIVLFQQSMAQV